MNSREDEGLTQSASERPVWEKFSADLKYLHNFFPSREVCQNSNSPPISTWKHMLDLNSAEFSQSQIPLQ